MAGPRDEMAACAAGRAPLRASHADREQVIEALKDAFADGRLAKDELDARAGQALGARTCAELATLTDDIPPAPAASPLRPTNHEHRSWSVFTFRQLVRFRFPLTPVTIPRERESIRYKR